MKFEPAVPSILGVTLTELEERLKSWGEPTYRARQVLDWIYKKRVLEWDSMQNIPKSLRGRLRDAYTILPSSIAFVKQASDVTAKLLLEMGDGAFIETVLIRHPQRGVGQESARKTVCISSQVGCAYGCRFCASGLAGWKRNLSTAEIVGQLLHVCTIEDRQDDTRSDAPFDNIVAMGMGEPLANYDNVVKAIGIINAEWGLRFGARRITVSTSGLVPQIRKLAEEPIQFRLAISLHGATDEVRETIMPINRRYPLAELVPAAREFAVKHGRMLTLEFILIQDINDTLDQARELARIAHDLHAHVNCIPYNSVEGLPWVRPSMPRQRAFTNVLRDAGISFTVRMEKGGDIDAACGQLRLRTENAIQRAQTIIPPASNDGHNASDS